MEYQETQGVLDLTEDDNQVLVLGWKLLKSTGEKGTK